MTWQWWLYGYDHMVMIIQYDVMSWWYDDIIWCYDTGLHDLCAFWRACTQCERDSSVWLLRTQVNRVTPTCPSSFSTVSINCESSTHGWCNTCNSSNLQNETLQNHRLCNFLRFYRWKTLRSTSFWTPF